jgi:hypothetical protein
MIRISHHSPKLGHAASHDAAEALHRVPMLVLRGEWLKAIGFPIGATAFLSTDKRGDITLTRMGLTRPRKLRVLKAKE